MIKIIYKKSNGDIIERVRNTLPTHSIGEYTSMGWLILDIQYFIGNDYYDYSTYKKILNKKIKKYHIVNDIKSYIKKYGSSLALLILLPLILLK